LEAGVEDDLVWEEGFEFDWRISEEPVKKGPRETGRANQW
jgi:hypothetical protein